MAEVKTYGTGFSLSEDEIKKDPMYNRKVDLVTNANRIMTAIITGHHPTKNSQGWQKSMG